MRKPKFHLVATTCRRCGKPLMTGNRSLLGLDEAKKKLDRICSECITPEETNEIRGLVPIIKGN